MILCVDSVSDRQKRPRYCITDLCETFYLEFKTHLSITLKDNYLFYVKCSRNRHTYMRKFYHLKTPIENCSDIVNLNKTNKKYRFLYVSIIREVNNTILFLYLILSRKVENY